MSGIINKTREAIHDATRPKGNPTTTTATTGSTVTTSGVPEGTAGPHGSRVANAADPRVDSDLDNRAQHGTGLTTGTTTTGTGVGAGVGTHGSTNAGPHSSNLANKMDPRVDSDLDGGRHAGLNQTTNPAGYTSTTGTHRTGLDGTATGSTNAGPHSSNVANKMDPRVDSDLDGGRHAGLNQTTDPAGHTSTFGHTTHTTTTGTTGTGVAGTTTGSTNAGPHKSNVLNKLDPRVDSDLDGSRNAGMNQTTNAAGHTSTVGTGAVGGTTSGSTNAGPHKSNVLNKLDPRVDSDLDGSRNAGMNQTTRTTY